MARKGEIGAKRQLDDLLRDQKALRRKRKKDAERAAAWRKRNPERFKATKRAWYQRNKERLAADRQKEN